MNLAEICLELKIPRSTIFDRIKKLGIVGEKLTNKQNMLIYNQEQVDMIFKSFNKDYKPSTEVREKKHNVVYIERFINVKETEVYYIYQSKMNYESI
jgi:predicted DNA-binding protein YlxM (UPF0122 family)